jgi:hypothetical protein
MGLDLPRDLGTRRLPFSRLARIVEHLPEDSAVVRARRDNRPTLELLFLRRIEYWTHLDWWGRTKAATQGRDRPVMVPLRGDHDAKRRGGLELDEKLARLERRRAERRASLEGRPAPEPRPEEVLNG